MDKHEHPRDRVCVFQLKQPLDCAALARFVSEVADQGLTQARSIIAVVHSPLIGNASLLSLLGSMGSRLQKHGIQLIAVSPAGDVAALLSEAAFPGLRKVPFVKSLAAAMCIASSRLKGRENGGAP